MNDETYRVLAEQTKEFLFSDSSGKSASVLNEKERIIRLKELITQVRKTAVRKFYQMPRRFHSTYTREDWIQEGMKIFCDLILKYRPERGTFDHYVRFILPRRFSSFQRIIFLKNPPLHEDLRKIVESFRRENGREPSAKEISDITGCKEDDILFFLNSVGKATIWIEGDSIEDYPEDQPFEDQYIQKEACKILRDCIENLEKKLKLLFIRHEFDGISFETLFTELGKILKSNSITTFKREYKKRIFKPVQNCVQNKYKINKSGVLKR